MNDPVPPTEVLIVPMTLADLPEVLAIEVECHVEPWHERFFVEELGKAHAQLLVARAGGSRSRVLGYICCWHIAGEVQIFNLAVQLARRRRGIGRALLLAVLAEGYSLGARIALLEVRSSNVAAQALYGQLGFRAVGTRPNYYGGLVEPAILMELEMTQPWKSRWLAAVQDRVQARTKACESW